MLFMGSTKECLAHFAATTGEQACKALMAEFCGVEPSTAQSWLSDQNEPTGDRIVKLRVFLYLAGYRVSELDDLSKSLRELCTMVAVGVCTPESVRDDLGYKNVQDVYRVLRGESTPLQQKLVRLNLLLESKRPELDKRLPSWKVRIEEGCESDSYVRFRPVHTAAASAPTISATAGEALSEGVVSHLVLALSELLDGLDDTVVDDKTALRAKLVDGIGQGHLVKLHHQLENLLQL